MEFSKDALPGLFKSLRPQPDKQDAAVRMAQKKWPIFQSVQAVLTQPPPSLTDDERAHWVGKGPVSDADEPIEPPSPAQTLANSLQSMILPAVETIPDKPPTAQRRQPQWGATTMPAVTATMDKEPDADSPVGGAELSPARTQSGMAAPSGADSLAQVFERLRGDKKVEAPAAQRKPSAFLSRLGKR